MTSKPGGKRVTRLAADANVILSAVIGKAALRVFVHGSVEVVTTSAVLEEVSEYLPVFAQSYGIAPEVVESQFRLLGIHAYERREYEEHLPLALRRIGKRDPDDAGLVALALALGIPIWSNDRDFEAAGVRYYPTAQLLRLLGL